MPTCALRNIKLDDEVILTPDAVSTTDGITAHDLYTVANKYTATHATILRTSTDDR